MTRVVLYARYSTDLQDARSIADQLALAREYAARQGWHVVAECTDPAVSGKSMLNRPGLRDLMSRAEARDFDVVLTEDLDRLARNQAHIALIYQDLEFLGVRIVTLADGEVSEMHIGLKGTMSALFLKDLVQKTRRGQIGRVQQGFLPGGLCYGYRLVKGEPGRRTVDESQAAIVRRIFAHYVAGVSPRAIVRQLNAEGVPSPKGGVWTVGTVVGTATKGKGVLNNPLYKGLIVYDRQRFPKDPRTGRRVGRLNAPDKRRVGEQPALAIVDAETWQKAQDLRASRLRKPRHRRQVPKHLLSGLLVCGVCGATMISNGRARPTVAHPDGMTQFRCSTHVSREGCENRATVSAPEIERRVLDGLRKSLASPQAVERAAARYREERARLAAERARTRRSTERELADVLRQLNNTARAIGSAGDVPVLMQQLAELEARRKALEARVPAAEADLFVHPNAARRYRDLVDNLGQALAEPEPHRARALAAVRRLISRIVVTPTAPRKPVQLEVFADLWALIDENGETRPDAVDQAAPLSISV